MHLISKGILGKAHVTLEKLEHYETESINEMHSSLVRVVVTTLEQTTGLMIYNKIRQCGINSQTTDGNQKLLLISQSLP